MCPQSEGSSRMIKWEKRVQSGVKSGEADSGWVLERGTSIATARGRKPRQGHVCDAAGGGGLPRPLPFPSARGKGLLGLRCQFQSVRPTLLGPDGILSVGTELSGEAGRSWRPETASSWGSHPWPDDAPNQQRRHDLGGWSGPRGAGRWGEGRTGAKPTPSNHRRHRAPSRHRRGPSRGRRARRGPRAPGPCPRAGRRGPR